MAKLCAGGAITFLCTLSGLSLCSEVDRTVNLQLCGISIDRVEP